MKLGSLSLNPPYATWAGETVCRFLGSKRDFVTRELRLRLREAFA